MRTFELYITYDGILCVKAETEEEALKIAKDMTSQEIARNASGTWDMDFSGVDYEE